VLITSCGVKKEELANGDHYVPVGNHENGNNFSKNERMGRRLWEWFEAEVKKSRLAHFLELSEGDIHYFIIYC
jgi:hypothetical protein